MEPSPPGPFLPDLPSLAGGVIAGTPTTAGDFRRHGQTQRLVFASSVRNQEVHHQGVSRDFTHDAALRHRWTVLLAEPDSYWRHGSVRLDDLVRRPSHRTCPFVWWSNLWDTDQSGEVFGKGQSHQTPHTVLRRYRYLQHCRRDRSRPVDAASRDRRLRLLSNSHGLRRQGSVHVECHGRLASCRA